MSRAKTLTVSGVLLFVPSLVVLQKSSASTGSPPILPQTLIATTLNATNFPTLFSAPVIKTVKESGGDYTDLQSAFNAIAKDAPNCNEIIEVASGYTAASLGSGQQLSYQYACPQGSWVWVRPSNYNSLNPQNQTICSSSITSASEDPGQTTATFTTSRNHLLVAGQYVRVKGVSDINFDGDYKIATASGNQFTVANTVASASATSSGGVELPENIYLGQNGCPDLSNMFVVQKTGGGIYDYVLNVHDDCWMWDGSSCGSSGASTSGLIISGMAIQMSAGVNTYIGVMLGEPAINTPTWNNHIIVDRVFMAAPLGNTFINGIMLNGPNTAVVDSYIDGVYLPTDSVITESHGISIYWAPGPYKIVDNYIGGMPSEDIFSGGTNVPVANMEPGDVEIRTNTIHNDWDHSSLTQARKNCIEFKAGQRLLIDGNSCDYSWNDPMAPQSGTAISFNTVTSGDAPWNNNQDNTITNNDIKHFGGIFLLWMGRSAESTTDPLNQRLLLQNNLFRDWDNYTYNLNSYHGLPGGGWLAEAGIGSTPASSGPTDTTFNHNGFYGPPSNQSSFGAFSGDYFSGTCPWVNPTILPIPNLTITSNITVIDQEYHGDCYQSFDDFNSVPGFLVGLNYSGNVHVQNGAGKYHFQASDYTTAGPNNQFPNGGGSGVAPAGMFVDYNGCVSGGASGPVMSCALQPGSAYHNRSYCDGVDCGPDLHALQAAQVKNNDDVSWGPRSSY